MKLLFKYLACTSFGLLLSLAQVHAFDARGQNHDEFMGSGWSRVLEDKLWGMLNKALTLIDQKLDEAMDDENAEPNDVERQRLILALEELIRDGDSDPDLQVLLRKLRNHEPLDLGDKMALRILSRYSNDDGLNDKKLDADARYLKMAEDLLQNLQKDN